ncbi:MAG: DUF4214 domain-containing protein [Acidimicrobiales bacterium]
MRITTTKPFSLAAVTAAFVLAVTILATPTSSSAESPPIPDEPASVDVPGLAGIDGEITRLYLALLDREPDAGGLDFWVTQRRDGMDLRQVAAHFHGSPEFADRFGHLLDADTGVWVDLLYDRILDRAPDAGGRAFWIERVDSGAMSREELIVHFSESTEFQVRTRTGVPGFLQLVVDSEAAYAGLGDDYTYRSSDWNYWFGPSVTEIEVSNGVVSRRSHWTGTSTPAGAPDWTETGAEVGSHTEGALALTVAEVHDACAHLLTSIDRRYYYLVVDLDDEGRLVQCGGLEYLIADAGNEVVRIEDLTEAG